MHLPRRRGLPQGTEDCGLTDCFLDAVGGNAVFVSNYNRRVKIAGCKITEAGASGVCFVGDPKAVRYSADEYGKPIALDRIDADARPEDRQLSGRLPRRRLPAPQLRRVEKQTAGVEISMSE